MSTAPLLKASGLYKNFGGVQAITNLSFELSQGELLGLIGPNGSGKTTMMNLISGALKPTSGTISLYGRKISGQPPHRLQTVDPARPRTPGSPRATGSPGSPAPRWRI